MKAPTDEAAVLAAFEQYSGIAEKFLFQPKQWEKHSPSTLKVRLLFPNLTNREQKILALLHDQRPFIIGHIRGQGSIWGDGKQADRDFHAQGVKFASLRQQAAALKSKLTGAQKAILEKQFMDTSPGP